LLLKYRAKSDLRDRQGRVPVELAKDEKTREVMSTHLNYRNQQH
jgi:hypothetical protein